MAFVLETLLAARDGHLLKAAAEELQGLLLPRAAQAQVHYLSPQQPAVTA
ncbi:hypothetical protein [Streptomyces sp. NPDC055400]